jgi:hypothetical protein
MSVASALAPAEADFKNRVMHATFGHLAPEPRKKYPGTILFVHGEYGDITIVRSTFNVPSSPWFYNHITDFVASAETEEGNAYLFTGYYMLFKNGNCQFVGTTKGVDIK